MDGIIDVEVNKIMLYGIPTYHELKDKLKIYETCTRRIRCYKRGEHKSSVFPHKSKELKYFKCNDFIHVGSASTNVKIEAATQRHEERRSSSNFGTSRRSYQPTKLAIIRATADLTQDNSSTADNYVNEKSITAAEHQYYHLTVPSLGKCGLRVCLC